MVGLFTIVLAFAAAFALWWFNGGSEQTDVYLLETRGNVTGLNLQAQVRYRGIRAGKVTDISPDKNDPGLLLVEIALDRKYRLTEKTIAKLNYQGVTGLAYIMLEEIDKDGPGRPLVTREDSPARLKILPGLIDKLGDKAGDVVSQITELGTRLNRMLDERNAQNVSRSLENLAVASEGLRELPKVVSSLKHALSDENLARLRMLLVHLEKTAGEAAPLTVEARSLLTTMNGLAHRLDGLATSAGGVSDRLNTETLSRAEGLMTEMTAATRRVERLLDTINETPQAFIFGAPPARPGPGENGFAVPEGR